MNDTCENCGGLLTHPPMPVADGGFDRPCRYCGAPNHEAPTTPVMRAPRPAPPPEPAVQRPPPTAVVSYFTVDPGAKAYAPRLATVDGYLHLGRGGMLHAPVLTSIGSYLHLSAGASLNAPLLESVGSYLEMSVGASLNAPRLAIVGGYVDVSDEASLNAPHIRPGAARSARRPPAGWTAIFMALGASLLLSLVGPVVVPTLANVAGPFVCGSDDVSSKVVVTKRPAPPGETRESQEMYCVDAAGKQVVASQLGAVLVLFVLFAVPSTAVAGLYVLLSRWVASRRDGWKAEG